MKVLCLIRGLLLLVTENCALVTGGSMQWNQIERGKNKYDNTESIVIMEHCWKNCNLPCCSSRWIFFFFFDSLIRGSLRSWYFSFLKCYQVLLGFKIIDKKLTYKAYDGSYSYDAFLKDVQEVFSLLLSLNPWSSQFIISF